jgi:hypothetical protein
LKAHLAKAVFTADRTITKYNGRANKPVRRQKIVKGLVLQWLREQEFSTCVWRHLRQGRPFRSVQNRYLSCKLLPSQPLPAQRPIWPSATKLVQSQADCYRWDGNKEKKYVDSRQVLQMLQEDSCRA